MRDVSGQASAPLLDEPHVAHPLQMLLISIQIPHEAHGNGPVRDRDLPRFTHNSHLSAPRDGPLRFIFFESVHTKDTPLARDIV